MLHFCNLVSPWLLHLLRILHKPLSNWLAFVYNLVFQEATTNGIVSLKYSPMSLLAEVLDAVLETFCHRSLGASVRVLPSLLRKRSFFGMRCYKEMIYGRIYLVAQKADGWLGVVKIMVQKVLFGDLHNRSASLWICWSRLIRFLKVGLWSMRCHSIVASSTVPCAIKDFP